MGNDFYNIVSEKFPGCQSFNLDGCDEIGDDLYYFGQVEVEVGDYSLIVRVDDDGNPALDIVHVGNILGVYYPTKREHLIDIIRDLYIVI